MSDSRVPQLGAALEAARARVAELERQPPAPGVAGTDVMRERYFDLLLEKAREDTDAQHIFDRIECLLDPGRAS